MYMGLTIREEASKLDTVDLETRTVIKYDSWRSMARWKRGIMSRPWWVLVNFVLFLASLATAILGIYSSIYSLVEALMPQEQPPFLSVASLQLHSLLATN